MILNKIITLVTRVNHFGVKKRFKNPSASLKHGNSKLNGKHGPRGCWGPLPAL